MIVTAKITLAQHDMQGKWWHLDLVSIKSWISKPLINLPLDIMATILAEDIFRCSFVNEKFCILIKNSLKFVLNVPIDNTQRWFR